MLPPLTSADSRCSHGARYDPGMDRLDRYVSILRNLGTDISESTTLLDFGCGDGSLVKSATSRGIDAYGCDVDFEQGHQDKDRLGELLAANRIRQIEIGSRPVLQGLSPPTSEHYRLPFDDHTFDVVISDQVLEHVSNFPEVVTELHRVMKPGGVFLHFFPSKFAVIEGHTKILFGGAFNPDWWLRFWANTGIRMWHQEKLTAKETAAFNRAYLDNRVNYLKKSDYIAYFGNSFRVKFVESELLKIHKKARIFLLPGFYANFWQRIMYGVRLDDSSKI